MRRMSYNVPLGRILYFSTWDLCFYMYIDDESSCLFRLSLKRAVSSFDIPEEGNCFLRQPCIWDGTEPKQNTM